MLKKRFMTYVLKTPTCWLWNGYISSDGYGSFRFRNRMVSAHRVSYILFKGDIGDGVVMHKCDTPACVRPGHLRAGTQLDNVHDRDMKGRTAIGTRHGRAKLTEVDVMCIRELQDTVIEQVYIADNFGVDARSIRKIFNRETWRHVA
jgi:hypothetical protein